jgi:hypothetical protein
MPTMAHSQKRARELTALTERGSQQKAQHLADATAWLRLATRMVQIAKTSLRASRSRRPKTDTATPNGGTVSRVTRYVFGAGSATSKTGEELRLASICKHKAAQARDPDVKRQFEALARSWLELAEQSNRAKTDRVRFVSFKRSDGNA